MFSNERSIVIVDSNRLGVAELRDAKAHGRVSDPNALKNALKKAFSGVDGRLSGILFSRGRFGGIEL